MPAFGEVPLYADAGPAAGALLVLAAPADLARTLDVGDAVEAVFVAGSAALMIRNVVATSYDRVMAQAPEYANRALDLLTIAGAQRTALASIETAHVAWWVDAGHTTLRVHETSNVNISMSAAAEVRDAQGNVKPPTPAPQPDWHQSMRYFRASQTTDDLYDSFRNVYLALESILSTVEPVRLNANGRPEGEGVWINRAIRSAAALVDLNHYLPAPAADFEEAVVTELYATIRTSIFHAKNGRPVMLPQDEAHRATVADALERYTRLYLDLSQIVLGTRFVGGVMTAAGFSVTFGGALGDLTLWVTSDASPGQKSDEVLAPTGAPGFQLATARRQDLDKPMYLAAMGTARAADVVAAVGVVRRAGALAPDGTLVQVAHWEQALDLSGMDDFECVFAVRGVNTQQARSVFAT
jgi:hypothetical protein